MASRRGSFVRNSLDPSGSPASDEAVSRPLPADAPHPRGGREVPAQNQTGQERKRRIGSSRKRSSLLTRRKSSSLLVQQKRQSAKSCEEDYVSATEAAEQEGAELEMSHEIPLRVIVNRLAGEPLDIEVPHQSTVSALKNDLAAKLGIPRVFVVLLSDTRTLFDSDFLYSYCDFPDTHGAPQAEPLVLTMLISLDSCNSSAKLESVKAIADLGPCGGQFALSALIAAKEDHDPEVRIAAVDALGAVAAKGDSRAILAVSTALEDRNPFVRRKSIDILPKIADRGDDCALKEVLERLNHPEPGVRHFAVEALSSMAEKGDDNVVQSLVACLGDSTWDVRKAVVRVLPALARPGDERVIGAVRALCNDPDSTVRKAAARAVPKLA